MNEMLWKLLALVAALSLGLVAGCPAGSADDDDDATADDDAADDDVADDDVGDDDVGDDDVGDDDTATGAYEVILLSSLTTDVEYFTFDTDDGVTVEYFAVIGSDGDPHVAFDACDNCYPAGLGYRQEGDDMICNNCGNSYAINSIGTENVGGGCWPGYLPIAIVADEIRILHGDLESGSYYFE